MVLTEFFFPQTFADLPNFDRSEQGLKLSNTVANDNPRFNITEKISFLYTPP